MLHIVATATPTELLRRCVVTTFRCTLASRHFPFCARSRYLVRECCRSQRMDECSFFVNLLHYGMYLLESFRMLLLIGLAKVANLFENVPFASCFDWAIPPIVLKLLLAMRQSESFRFSKSIGQAGIPSALMILFSRAIEKFTRTRFRDRHIYGHHHILVANLLFRLFLGRCWRDSCFLCFFSERGEEKDFIKSVVQTMCEIKLWRLILE